MRHLRFVVVALTLLCTTSVFAQFTSGGTKAKSAKSGSVFKSDTREYTLLQIGYAAESFYDGLFIECIKSKPVYRGLSLEYGLRGQWEMYSMDDFAEDMFEDYYGDSYDDWYGDFQDEYVTTAHYIDLKAKIGVSYPFKMTENFSLIPHAGLQLGAKIGCVEDLGTRYAMGMDLGLRGRYKKFFVSYAYTIAFTGMLGTHSIGLGIAL